MRARDVMTTGVVTVVETTPIKEAARLLVEHSISGLPVTNGGDRLVGIVTEADLLPVGERPDPRHQARPVDAGEVPRTVAEVMRRDVVTAVEDADVADLAQLMLAAHVKRVPIVRDGKVVGIVSRRDLVRVLARSDADIERELEGLLRREGLLDAGAAAPVEAGVARIPDPEDEKARSLLRSVAGTVPGVLGVVFGATPDRLDEQAVELLGADECLRLLRSRDLGRIAFAVDGQPHIIPLNYAVEGRTVVIRTAPGSMLTAAPATEVAFEVDGHEPGAGLRWSVVVRGTAQDVTSSIDTFSSALRKLDVRPAAPGERRHWLAIYANEISGRRFASRAGVGAES